MCGVVFNLLLAGERLGGGVCREPDRQQLTFPHCKSFSFPLSLSVSCLLLRLFFYSQHSFLTPPSLPPVPRPLAVSFISSWLLCVCSRLLLSAALFIILSFVFICFVGIPLSICLVFFSINHF